jgi:hypothetical protein
MNTGADDVFILDRARAVELGDGCFLPLLTDREMERYTIPELLTKAVFYPYRGEKLVDEETLRQSFPLIWNYLSQFKEALGKRASVVRGDLPWWRPERPRAPKEMLRPKIVTPHLVVAARFALDTSGEVAVSRSPIIFSKLGKKYERDHLLYLLGVLNSSLMFWDISRRSHVYSRGYSRLEKATFRGLRIPDFSLADQRLVKAIVKFTESRLRSSGNLATDLEREIDLRVAQLYNLSEEEQNMIGLDFHEV